MNDTRPVALVTGASTGIGASIARTLVDAGYAVYGTSRRERPDADGVRMRVMEVRSDESVEDCVAGILAETGRIDLVVNNAAQTIVSPAEELPIPEAAALMDLNFFGVARVVNAVLPTMRHQRAGHLIFISSLGGLMGIPGQGYYCATKHAMEGYVDGLYLELAQFGIRVTSVEPGSFRTEILETSPLPDWPTMDHYDGYRESLREIITEATAKGGDPQQVANVVASVATKTKPKVRYRVDGDGKRAIMFKTLLPQRTFYRIMGQRFGA
ncbi:MAG: SDR family NAD(P)-dependent oxidoreductase [Actinomycetota bacterium]